MEAPTWRPVRVKLRDLKPWERNPRRMTKEHAERLLQSWQTFGQVQTIAIGPDGEVYDGHQRIRALMAAKGPDYEVWALQASRPLTEEERAKVTLLLHAGTLGEWDWDQLANWDSDILLEGGMDEALLETFQRDAAALSFLLETAEEEDSVTEEEELQPFYTVKIESPVYQPSGALVSISALYDDEQYRQLVERIMAANVSEEFQQFALLAAGRFVRFHFDRIADYYAQASSEEQRLMEDLAVIIIDFEDAIAKGFVQVTEQLMSLINMEDAVDVGG